MAGLDRFSSSSLSMARTLSAALGSGASITASRSCSLAAALESMTEIVSITKQLSAGLEAIPDVEQLQVRRRQQPGFTLAAAETLAAYTPVTAD
jgi:hypothetical protein